MLKFSPRNNNRIPSILIGETVSVDSNFNPLAFEITGMMCDRKYYDRVKW